MEFFKPVGMYVMEQIGEPSVPSNIQRFNHDGLNYIRFDATLQSFNVYNRNRRLYTSQAIMESLQAEHIRELIKYDQWKGEAGHPISDDPKRIVTIDPKLTSHKIKRFWTEGNLLKAEIETLDDVNGFGRKMTNEVLQGGKPSFSLRALCPLVQKGDGSCVCKQKGHIVTYDWVVLPSHKEAYMDTSSPYKRLSESLTRTGNGCKDMLVPVNESSLLDYISDESSNVKIVSNLAEITCENMTLTSNNDYVMLKDGNEKYYVKLEDKIKHEVSQYMSKFGGSWF